MAEVAVVEDPDQVAGAVEDMGVEGRLHGRQGGRVGELALEVLVLGVDDGHAHQAQAAERSQDEEKDAQTTPMAYATGGSSVEAAAATPAVPGGDPPGSDGRALTHRVL